MAPADRFFPATIMGGHLHVRGIPDWGPWNSSRLEWADEEFVDMLLSKDQADRKARTREELEAIMGEPKRAPSREVSIHESLVDEARRLWEQITADLTFEAPEVKIVSAQALLKGSWYALEQCGLLLRHAKILHQATAYPTAVALSLIAREELGRYYILRDLWRQTAQHGEQFSVDEVKKRCEDHVVRQRLGQLIVALRGDPNAARLVEALQTYGIDSQEAREAETKVWESSKRRRKRVPDQRHLARMSAIYVDLKPSGDWNRPSDIGKDGAANALQDAANDYALTRVPLLSAIEHRRDPQLASAVEAWPDRPDLPLPSWPD